MRVVQEVLFEGEIKSDNQVESSIALPRLRVQPYKVEALV